MDYIKNSKESGKKKQNEKLLELRNKFIKVAEYKFNTQNQSHL